MRRPRSVLTLALVAGAALGGGCVDFGLEVPAPTPRSAAPIDVPDDCEEGAADPSEATETIQFSTLDVDRRDVTVAPGGVVLWVNGSTQAHTASAGAPGADLPADRGGFDSGNMAPGGSQWAYRFCNPRSILWYCRTHPAQMFGYRIVVGAEGGSS